jgi:hypothetical protein
MISKKKSKKTRKIYQKLGVKYRSLMQITVGDSEKLNRTRAKK